MLLLIFFSLLLLGALLAACACWVACLWLLTEQQGSDVEAARPLSLSQSFAREIDARRLWRSLSAWMAAKPLRLEDGRAKRPAG